MNSGSYFRRVLLIWIVNTTLNCEAAWFHRNYNNHVYYFSENEQQTWDAAQANCTGMNADLVTVNAAVEGNYLRSRTGRVNDHWIGKYCKDPTLNNKCEYRRDLVWVSGDAVDYTDYWPNDFQAANVQFAFIRYPADNWGITNSNTDTKRYICEKPDGCINPDNPCQNGGTCTPDTSGGFTCDCTSQFTGDVCEMDIDECDLGTQECQNGDCSNTEGDYTCECYPGYTGNRCETDFDECVSSPCHHGWCRNLINQYTCTCNEFYTGVNCESDIDECTNTPNVCNNGSCTNSVGGYDCSCYQGYSGGYCNQDINECSRGYCQNGATCINYAGSYECTCASGYTGQNCVIEVDECESNPCMNGATCIDSINAYECDCPPTVTGTHCEIDIDECERSQYCGGWNCTNTYGGYECDCPQGYAGQECRTDINECLGENACNSHGECSNTIGGFHCSCDKDFYGERCQVDINALTKTEKNTAKFSNVSIGLSVALLMFILISAIAVYFIIATQPQWITRFRQDTPNQKDDTVETNEHFEHHTANQTDHDRGTNADTNNSAKEIADSKEVALELESSPYEITFADTTYGNVDDTVKERSGYEELGPVTTDHQPYELDIPPVYITLHATNID